MSADRERAIELGIDAIAVSGRLLGMLGMIAGGVETQLNEIVAEDPDLAPEIEAMRQHFVDGVDAGHRLVKFLQARAGLVE